MEIQIVKSLRIDSFASYQASKRVSRRSANFKQPPTFRFIAKGFFWRSLTYAYVSVFLAVTAAINVDAQAPVSLSGNSFGIGITAGTYPFASAGYYLFLPASAGDTYRIVGIDNVANSSGTYFYTSVGADGTVSVDDSIAGPVLLSIDFAANASGSYYAANAGFSASQSGIFEMFSGQVPHSITGMIIECTVQTGNYPLAGAGTFTFETPNSGNTYTVIGDGLNTANSSGTYSYSEINKTTGAIQIDDSLRGSATVYVAFSTANSGGYAIKSVALGGFQIGNFVTTATGSLKVSISPASAITAGAQWQVDGGTWQNSGATEANLSVGNHTISFTSIDGCATPANQIVAVRGSSTVTATGNYVAFGSLQVIITPSATATSGAQWQVDGGAWQNSGATVGNLSPGNHAVSFSGIDHWSTPASQTVLIKSKSVAKITGAYSFSGQGIYNGLFMQSGVTAETAGMLSDLDITASGTYTGKLLVGGSTNPISGNFNGFGQATNNIARSVVHGGPMLLQMDVDWNETPLNIVGTVSATNGGPWMANLSAELEAPPSSSEAYTAWMQPDSIPPGYGYMLITNHAGTVALSITLADGTSFSEAVPASGAGDLPIYGNLYGGTGLLLGWLGLESGAPAGKLTWIKPASGPTTLYPTGFTNIVSLQGAPWTNPLPKTAAIDLSSGQLEISGGSLLSNLTFNISVNDNNMLMKLSGGLTNSLTGSITPTTGLLTITFGNGVGKATTVAKGVVLQNSASAAGFFLGKTNAGSLLLQPN